jgi:hypothetical protein
MANLFLVLISSPERADKVLVTRLPSFHYPFPMLSYRLLSCAWGASRIHFEEEGKAKIMRASTRHFRPILVTSGFSRVNFISSCRACSYELFSLHDPARMFESGN